MLLIKDLDLPKRCADCRLKNWSFGECNVTHRKIRTWSQDGNTRADWCPLEEIEIVRCGECKWWDNKYPTRCTRNYGILMGSDDHCSKGERKKDGAD